jgi:hypothetical protein
MLEGLDTIDWTSLTHAHGAATNVPDLLRSLLSEDGNVRQEAIADLHEMIWHQGSVYPASAAAIPFLYELLTHPDVQDKGGIVSLLGSIATGEGDWERNVRNDGDEMWRSNLAKQGKSLEQKLAEEAAAMKAIHCAVSLGLRHLLPYLSDREGLAPLMAETLGKYPEHATWLVPAIDAALQLESDEYIREALAKSKARLTNSGSGPAARAAEPGR